MALYLFINPRSEILIGAIHGVDTEAKRYGQHLQKNHNAYTLVVVKNGLITVGDTEETK